MASAIRLTGAEREFLARKIDEAGCTNDKEERLRASVLAKLEASEMPVRKTGLSAQVAVEAFAGVLGNRLVQPPRAALGVWGAMGNRLRMLGLTRGDCVTIAKVAAAAWRGPIKAESLVRQADTLLSGAQMEVPGTSAGPVALEEDDYK